MAPPSSHQSPPPSSGLSPLLLLPRELRDQIYAHALLSTSNGRARTVYAVHRNGPARPGLPSLLRTSKQIGAEAGQVLYSQVPVKWLPAVSTAKDIADLVNAIPRTALNVIRVVEMSLVYRLWIRDNVRNASSGELLRIPDPYGDQYGPLPGARKQRQDISKAMMALRDGLPRLKKVTISEVVVGKRPYRVNLNYEDEAGMALARGLSPLVGLEEVVVSFYGEVRAYTRGVKVGGLGRRGFFRGLIEGLQDEEKRRKKREGEAGGSVERRKMGGGVVEALECNLEGVETMLKI